MHGLMENSRQYPRFSQDIHDF